MGTAYELAAYGLQNELTHTRQRCFECARAKRSEFKDAADLDIMYISEQGNYAIGSDAVKTFNEFEANFPDDHSRRTCFIVEDVRHG